MDFLPLFLFFFLFVPLWVISFIDFLQGRKERKLQKYLELIKTQALTDIAASLNDGDE